MDESFSFKVSIFYAAISLYSAFSSISYLFAMIMFRHLIFDPPISVVQFQNDVLILGNIFMTNNRSLIFANTL